MLHWKVYPRCLILISVLNYWIYCSYSTDDNIAQPQSYRCCASDLTCDQYNYMGTIVTIIYLLSSVERSSFITTMYSFLIIVEESLASRGAAAQVNILLVNCYICLY